MQQINKYCSQLGGGGEMTLKTIPCFLICEVTFRVSSQKYIFGKAESLTQNVVRLQHLMKL